jgi:hypothetical protein
MTNQQPKWKNEKLIEEVFARYKEAKRLRKIMWNETKKQIKHIYDQP